MCMKCGNDNCIGSYLLHPVEVKEVPRLKEKELKEDPDTTFLLIDSPSSGEMFVKFKELHVISKKRKEEKDKKKEEESQNGGVLI